MNSLIWHLPGLWPVSYTHLYTYQNTLYKLQMTGEQLRRFMEWSAAFFKTWKPDEVTIAFDPSVRYYLYDAFEGVSYELDVSKEPGHRIKNLKSVSYTHLDVYKRQV